MLILATSKIQSNYQTTIPKEIRKNYDIDNDTVVEWAINEKGNPEINFRKKRRFKDLVGAFKTEEKTNAVELKRSLYERTMYSWTLHLYWHMLIQMMIYMKTL